jgi:hypothetical protein
MGKLNVSLDGFVETPDHRLDWAGVDDELHHCSTTRPEPSTPRSTAGGCTS